MSIKRTVLGVVATLTIVGGVNAVAALPASAATPGCGPNCLGVFSDELGTYHQPNFIEHVFGGTASVGTPTGLTAASASDTSEDFINPHPNENVSGFYAMGLVSAAVNQHYGSQPATQLEYEPSGMPTGLCVGLAADPVENEALSLQPCTVPGRTVWFLDLPLSAMTADGHLVFPIVSGATTDFARPFAMTYPHNINTDKALPPIRVRHLQLLGDEHTLPDNQLWGVIKGMLP
jgi:hypothetical protein